MSKNLDFTTKVTLKPDSVTLGSYIPTPDKAVRFRVKSLHADCDKCVSLEKLNEGQE